jgi:predicted nuclease with TOPRIM domain
MSKNTNWENLIKEKVNQLQKEKESLLEDLGSHKAKSKQKTTAMKQKF